MITKPLQSNQIATAQHMFTTQGKQVIAAQGQTGKCGKIGELGLEVVNSNLTKMVYSHFSGLYSNTYFVGESNNIDW